MSHIAKAKILHQISKTLNFIPPSSLKFSKEIHKGDIALVTRHKLLSDLKDEDLESHFSSLGPYYVTNVSNITTKTKGKNNLRKTIFNLNPQFLAKHIIHEIQSKQEMFGFDREVGKNKKILMEFSSPNIAKPFHAGHLRSTVIGSSLSNLHKKFGYDVVNINYLGDWGKQYGLLAVGYKKYGNRVELEKDAIRHLFEVYVKISKDASENNDVNAEARAMFYKLSSGDKEAKKVWKEFKELSVKAYNKTYGRLGITFDESQSESQMDCFVPNIIEKLKCLNMLKSVSEDTNGQSMVCDFDGTLDSTVLVKYDGTSVYLTRDLGAIQYRFEKFGNFDKLVYVAGEPQKTHFRQLFYLAEKLGFEKNKFQHVFFGSVKGMSTRKGDVVFLEDILDQSRDSVKTIMLSSDYSKVKDEHEQDWKSDILGMSAVVVKDVSGRIAKGYEFSWERILTSKGETGIYLQYQHARLNNVAINNRDIKLCSTEEINFSLLQDQYSVGIIGHLDLFPEVTRNALETMDPSYIIQYAMKLAKLSSQAFTNNYVKGQPDDLANARFILYDSTRIVLATCLKLLNLVPLKAI